ncbi:MAG: glycosyltransferase family 4 protein [Deltaproteobacteria bacterium]|nr:glycosyltransferase family 4 protein [Deltaproteobacteria bacterium]
MPRPLRIAFVAYRGNMNSGGQGIYLWFLAREMARQGHEVDVFVGPPYPDPMPFARVVELPNQQFWAKWVLGQTDQIVPRKDPLQILTPLNFYELVASRIGFLPELAAFSFRAFRRIAEELRAGARYDLVHDVQCLGYGLLGLRAMGLPVVTTVHHPLTVDRRASFVRDETLLQAIGTMKFYPIGMQSFVARRLDAVLTSSEVGKRQIAQDFAVSPDRLINVRNGLDTELFRPDPGIAKRPGEILCIGRSSDPNKGIRTLVRALAKLPPQIRLTLVDDDNSDNKVRRWAGELSVQDRLTLTGRVDSAELLALYRRAELVVVPSRYEGFGLPAVEAMACGTPVVATRAGALTEVMERTGGGLLTPRDDPDALAAAIAALMADPERRSALARNGRERVVEAYSWPEIARTTADAYRSVIARRRSRPAHTSIRD